MFFSEDKKIVFNLNAHKFKLLCPKIFKFNKKLYRMYFSFEKRDKQNKNFTIIKSAISKNCNQWFIEKGSRIESLQDKRFCRFLSPSLIKIEKFYRMYFEARTIYKKAVIKSAISKDGFIWSEEPGVRIGKSNKYSYGTPFCLQRKKNYFELFYEKRTNNKRDIWCVKSTDGFNFDETKSFSVIKQDSMLENYCITGPDVDYSNDCYQMYYSGWGGNPVKGQIFFAYSSNNKIWKKSKMPIIIPDGKYDKKHCSEPSIIKINNKLKIFYEGCDKNNFWRILCAQKM